MPFVPAFAVRCIADIERLEAVPLEQALTVRSTYEIIRDSAQAFGDKTAITFLRSGNPEDATQRWSYRELLADVHRTANLLHSLGVTPGDAVAVLLPGCYEYHLALWGGAAAGIVQPLNPLLSDDKLASLVDATRAKVLIAWGDGEMGSKAQRLKESVASLRHVLRVGDGAGSFGELLRSQQPDRLVSGRDIAPTDIAAYFHTGGTTGSPKLARHSHGAQVFTAWACVQMQGTRPDDVAINGYPLFHVAGVLPGALTSFAAGAEQVIPTPALFRNKEVLANYWKLVDRHKATVLSGVPTVLAALCEVPIGGADISSLRYCRTGAAALAPELASRFEQHTGLHVHEAYGMTEMAGISTIRPPGVSASAGCVGFRVPYSLLRIVEGDENGRATNQDVPAGAQGMVLFRSPNVFSGFLDEKDDRDAFTADGWLATGDLGWIDGEGRLNLGGRSKDLIIRGGHNIDPKVIEDALGSHPAVQLCAAVGAPDAYAGELPVAFATLVPGATVTEEELLAFTAERVDEPPARPKWVAILPSMPVTTVGKIFKPELRELAAKRSRP